jgi:hypothetical protein
MLVVSEKKPPEKLQTGKTISRREALQRIFLAAPMIAILSSCGGTRQNINSGSSSVGYYTSGYTGIQYVLLESDLIDLKKQGIEKGLVKKLHPLIGKWFPKEEFAVEIEKLIGKADSEVYFPIIINVAHHARFNRGRECGIYMSCAGMTATGDCCDDPTPNPNYSSTSSYYSYR